MGGKDPYSASKAAAEMVIQSYASSFPFSENKGPAIATARGGNIIGGGDWSEDRLIPDFVRSVVNDLELTLRFPDATRPWQHVLALVHGYLVILAGLISNDPLQFACPWNLGPQDLRQYSVREVLNLLITPFGEQDITIKHLDEVLYEGTVMDEKMLELVIRPDGCNKPTLGIDIQIKNPRSPYELGQSDDTRKLGIALLKFELH